MKITCVSNEEKDVRGNIILKEIDLLNEVIYITIYRKIPLFHTQFGQYLQIVTLEVLNTWLKPHGFERLDNVSIVKFDKITKIDAKECVVYFDGNMQTSVAVTSVSKLEKIPKYKVLMS